jgi:hypothetical protein
MLHETSFQIILHLFYLFNLLGALDLMQPSLLSYNVLNYLFTKYMLLSFDIIGEQSSAMQYSNKWTRQHPHVRHYQMVAVIKVVEYMYENKIREISFDDLSKCLL